MADKANLTDRYMALGDRGEWVIWDWDARAVFPGVRYQDLESAQNTADALNRYNSTWKGLAR